MEILVGRQGTQRTPITDTTVSRQHCKILVNADGSYTLENISANGTFVNGTSIIRTGVTPDTIIRLGATFTIAVRDLLPLQAAVPQPSQQSRQQAQQPQQATVDPNQERYEREFRKLEGVYERYTEQKIAMQKEVGKANFYRMLPMTLVSIVGLAASLIPGLGSISHVIAVLAIGLFALSLYKSYNNSNNNPEKMEALNRQFQIDYVCPKCGNFLGFTPYKALKNKSTCNYCKCKWS